MTHSDFVVLHKSGTEAANGQTFVFRAFQNYLDAVFFFDVTVIGTALDLVLDTINIHTQTDNVTGDFFNIMDDFEFRDILGAIVALTASGGENVLRFSATGQVKARLKSGFKLCYAGIRLRWVKTGTDPTFSVIAEAKTEEATS